MESTQHSTGPLDLGRRSRLDLRPTRPVLDLRERTDEQWQEWSKWQEWSEQPQEPKVVPATVHQPQQHSSHTPKVVPATRPQPQQQSGQHEPKVVPAWYKPSDSSATHGHGQWGWSGDKAGAAASVHGSESKRPSVHGE